MCERIIEQQLVLVEHQAALAELVKPSELVLTELLMSRVERSMKRISFKGKQVMNSEQCSVVYEIIKDA